MKTLIIFLCFVLISGCATTSTQGKKLVVEERKNFYNAGGYYKGYSKTLPSGKTQYFDEEGYYTGQSR